MLHRIGVLCLCCGLVAATKPNRTARRWWAHVQILASDSMEGRDTGSEGYRRAARYVVQQFERAGLKPAGRSGYYQSVPIRALRMKPEQSSISLVREGAATPLRINHQIAVTPRAGLPESVDAPMIFVGYGNDLAGLDLAGKIVVYFNATPAGISSEARTRATAERTKALAGSAAAGVMAIDNPRAIEPPRWPVAYATAMSIDSGERNPRAGPALSMRFNPVYADESLLRGSGHSVAEFLDLTAAGKQLPRFTLPVSLRAQIQVDSEKLASDNIVAVLPGSDAALSNEYVVVSAHLDAYGIGEPVNGDRIYNGAFDDAACVANLIELASDLHRSGKRLRRSLLFAVFTGEEKGLLGSNYFVAHPTVAKERMVTDINLDYIRPLFPLKILTTLGLEESTLGEAARKVAEPLGIRIQTDDEPERGLFRRSDQYNFIRNGIPGIAFIFGYEKGSPEEAIYRKWYADRYHRPSDDLKQPVDMGAAAKFNQFFQTLVEVVANADQRPRVLPGSDF